LKGGSREGGSSGTGDESRLIAEIRELIDRNYFAVLATRGKEYPYCTLVGFAATADLRHILFATKRHTRKYGNITADRRVSLLMDSRTNRAEDVMRAKALTALGKAEELRGAAAARLKKTYLERHPNLRGFAENPNTALFRVKIDRYILVSRFQEVFELEIE